MNKFIFKYLALYIVSNIFNFKKFDNYNNYNKELSLLTRGYIPMIYLKSFKLFIITVYIYLPIILRNKNAYYFLVFISL